MIVRLLTCLLLLASFAVSASPIDVTAVHDDRVENEIAAKLHTLAGRYPLQRWIVDRDVRVDREVWPSRSHPVVTIAGDPRLLDERRLLATLLHEQIHRLFITRGVLSPTERAARTAARFPGAVTAPPFGSGSLASTYNHVLVCYLEYKALQQLLGAEQALAELQAKKYYRWVYALVADPTNEPTLDALLEETLGDASPLRTRD